jgi:hypothetical protein
MGRKRTLGCPKIFLSYTPSPVLASPLTQREDTLLQLARARRPCRAGEWTEAKAVTFIVTLAASQSVTLAAARASMSRKSAYALRNRDPAFDAAWNAAISVAGARRAEASVQVDEIGEVDSPRFKDRRGCKKLRTQDGPFDALMRDLFFAAIANQPGTSRSASLARGDSLP